MTRKMDLFTFSFFPLFLIVQALALAVPTASVAETKKDERFYVVYLVSIIDLKPGAKAFVDPVFFTDGSQIRNVFDYCRFRLNAIGSPAELKPQQIGDNLKAVHAYCENQPVTLSGNKYYTLGNSGSTVGLGPINFSPGASSPGISSGRYVMPSPFPYPGIATVTSVNAEPPTVELNTESSNRPGHFFLMSSNKSVLEQLVPVQRIKADERAALVNGARRYAHEIKGVTRVWRHRIVSGRAVVEFIQRAGSLGFANAEPKIVDALFADLDDDGRVDVAAGMTAQSESGGGTWWGGLGFLYSRQDSNFVAGLQSPANYEVHLSYGHVVHAPLALIRTKQCKYVLTMLTEWGESYQLMSQPQETAACPYRNLTRWESHL